MKGYITGFGSPVKKAVNFVTARNNYDMTKILCRTLFNQFTQLVTTDGVGE